MIGKLLAVAFCLLLSAESCFARTVAEECQSRALQAYDQGTTEEQKRRLGQEAAAACFKEMRAKVGDTAVEEASASGRVSESNASSSSLPIIALMAVLSFVAFKLIPWHGAKASASDLLKMRDELEAIYAIDSSDSDELKTYKTTRLAREKAGIEMMIADRSVRLTRAELLEERDAIVQRIIDMKQPAGNAPSA